jgi:dihydroorotate dehydrogenase electron transfer subunit
MIETKATVQSNQELSHGYKLITLRFSEPVEVLPGQFAMLRAHSAMEPILRRALAVYRAEGPRQLTFLYQILGRGTAALAVLQPGSLVDALVPLGNCWPIPAPPRPEETGQVAAPRAGAIVVAGGIGSASLLMLCEELARAKVETTVLFGAANLRAATGCGLEDFKALGQPVIVSTDDGSLGEKGLVTETLTRYLTENTRIDRAIYTCGPWKMMARTAQIAGKFGVRCLASLEAPMGCGFGVCVGCVVAMRSDGPAGYDSYRRVCVDGTIFPAEKIRWEVAAMAH